MLNPKTLIGHLVLYRYEGLTLFWGIAEYLTPDGWFGIRQAGGRLDEAPAALCEPDPT
jgi:hypothetical protein